MKFAEYRMPEYIEDSTANPDLHRILRIYHTIENGYRLDLTQTADQNELLDEFVGQRAFIALDDEQKVQAVANYVEKPNRDYGWIEGIAVHTPGLKIGRFMIQNLVRIAEEDGRDALELQSLPSVVGFYIRQGFDYTDENPDPRRPRMRRQLN